MFALRLIRLNGSRLSPGACGSSTSINPNKVSRGRSRKIYAYREEIFKQAADKGRPQGWLQPKDVTRGNDKQCVSLVRAVIPDLPHSSQWWEGGPVTPENAGAIPPGTAIATLEDGRSGNAQHWNHAAIYLDADSDQGRAGIHVLDQFVGRHGDPGEVKERFYPFEPSPDSHYLAGAFSVIMGWPAPLAAIVEDRGWLKREEQADGHLHHWN
ncbi:MAG: BPSL0067 family protein [Terriglobia bacterium]